ncbi:uncharacterized protein LOC123885559 isoform X4 [Trifolium pratense]|nr:uncharacterized protein LOC123885559 isoform X4 [Trifolium pratense]XP_045790798.1 uncharacterized protein LOC123885559 isoform X4 [Trifolium pratense]
MTNIFNSRWADIEYAPDKISSKNLPRLSNIPGVATDHLQRCIVNTNLPEQLASITKASRLIFTVLSLFAIGNKACSVIRGTKTPVGKNLKVSYRLISNLSLTTNLEMSSGGAFGGNRGLRPVPPEKGVFPLDHMHLCDLDKKEYLNCLKTAGNKSEICREFSKKYLQCRMEKNLMAKQDLAELGFKEVNAETPGGKITERIGDRNQ